MKFSDTIGIIPNVLSKNECNDLISLFESYNKTGETYTGSTLGGVESAKKSTDYNLLNHREANS